MKKGSKKFNFTIKNPGNRRSKKDDSEPTAENAKPQSKSMKINDERQDYEEQPQIAKVQVQSRSGQPAAGFASKPPGSSIFGLRQKELKGILGKLLQYDPKSSPVLSKISPMLEEVLVTGTQDSFLENKEDSFFETKKTERE